jgi:protein-S-isoprenylcysteine O-methyltransferase Ste14
VLIFSRLLALICWSWRPIPAVVCDVTSPVFSGPPLGLFAIGWLILLLATFRINRFDPFGLRQACLRMRGMDYTPLKSTQRVLCKFVHHPVMLGVVIAFWFAPLMSVGQLVLLVATSGYIVIRTLLEERDLMHHHGAEYGAHRGRPDAVPDWHQR